MSYSDEASRLIGRLGFWLNAEVAADPAQVLEQIRVAHVEYLAAVRRLDVQFGLEVDRD